MVSSVEAKAGTTGSVGIGIPGSLDPLTGIAKGASSTWLNGRPVEADLRRTLGREVRVANDADCFAVSEAVDGAARVTTSSSRSSWAQVPEPEWPLPVELIMDRTTVLASGAIIRSPDRTSPKFPDLPVIAAETDASSDGSRAGPLRATTISTPASIWPPPSPWTGRDRGPDEARRSTGEACVESVCRSR